MDYSVAMTYFKRTKAFTVSNNQKENKINRILENQLTWKKCSGLSQITLYFKPETVGPFKMVWNVCHEMPTPLHSHHHVTSACINNELHYKGLKTKQKDIMSLRIY